MLVMAELSAADPAAACLCRCAMAAAVCSAVAQPEPVSDGLRNVVSLRSSVTSSNSMHKLGLARTRDCVRAGY